MSNTELRWCIYCEDSFEVDGGEMKQFVASGRAQGHRFVSTVEMRYNKTLAPGWTCKHCVDATPEQIQANRVAAALKVKR